MQITLELPPEIEHDLATAAQQRGLSLREYIERIVAREAHITAAAAQGSNLVELSEPVRGLLSDEEVEYLFRRQPSPSRPLDLR